MATIRTTKKMYAKRLWNRLMSAKAVLTTEHYILLTYHQGATHPGMGASCSQVAAAFMIKGLKEHPLYKEINPFIEQVDSPCCASSVWGECSCK